MVFTVWGVLEGSAKMFIIPEDSAQGGVQNLLLKIGIIT